MKKRMMKKLLKVNDHYLQQYERIDPNDPLIYCGELHFILKNGKLFKFHPRRSFVPNAPTPVIPLQCYKNSIQYAMETGLRYVEGIALSKSMGPMGHGWCINEFNNVRDVTWDDGMFYFGVEIPIYYVIKQNDGNTNYAGCFSILQESSAADRVYAKNENEINCRSKELLTGLQPYPIKFNNQTNPDH